jgi:hypothetical protein
MRDVNFSFFSLAANLQEHKRTNLHRFIVRERHALDVREYGERVLPPLLCTDPFAYFAELLNCEPLCSDRPGTLPPASYGSVEEGQREGNSSEGSIQLSVP